MVILKSFRDFLLEYRVIGVSIGFIVAIAASNFIQSFVKDIFLPVLRPFISQNALTWEDMIWTIGSVNLRIGSFSNSFFSLLFITIILYVIVAKVMRWKPNR